MEELIETPVEAPVEAQPLETPRVTHIVTLNLDPPAPVETLDPLEDHVDEPIKKCVVGMALLGFQPLFSCCGFTYRGEKVKKDHIWGKPYIFLNHAIMSGPLKALLVDLSINTGWTIGNIAPTIVDFYFYNNAANTPPSWKEKDSPHFHEPSVLAISRLEKQLEALKEHFKPTEIKDGNVIWKEDLKIRHWQYPSCASWKVTPETFDSL